MKASATDDISASLLPGLSPADPTRTSAPRPAPPVSPGPADDDDQAPIPQYRDPGRYQIIGEHGRGGLGRVSRAHDRELGRDIAIKELLSRGHVSEVRFLREALITARLEHPGIVPVHEAGRWPDGTPFYAMKLVAGRPLRDLIAERTTIPERIGLLHHVIAIADAIAYAHGRSIIHRDLKPANVIVGDFGETIVIDWGLAKDLSAAEEATIDGGPFRTSHDDSLTADGSILGTPAYMAPEQLRGDAVDQRADVFAIGAMLWELCSVHKLPPSDAAQRHRMLRRARIDNDLVAIIDKAIDPDLRRRYRDAGALAADLKAFKSGARITARSYSLAAMLAHWTRRHRILASSVMALIVGAAVLYRAALQTRTAEQLAEMSITQAAVEQGRQALLHGDSAEALQNLTQAYQRGDHSPGVAFMLARAQQSRLAEQARFSSTSGPMWSAAFSPDGGRIVTTDDRNAQIWDAQTSQLLFTLPHGATVYHAVYSADGTTLVTAAGDATVKIWNAASGVLVRTLTHAEGQPLHYCVVRISPDDQLIAAIDTMGAVVHVWNANTGAVVAELGNDGSEYPSLGFSADGRWLATTGGNDVRVFDTRTWAKALTIAVPRIRGLSWDPTGPRVLTGTAAGDAAIWQIPGGARLHHLRDVGEPVDRVAFSPDGALVAAASRDGAELVWNAGSGAPVSQGNYLRGKVQWIEFDPSSTLVLASGANGMVVVADAAQGISVAVLEGPEAAVTVAHFDPTSRRVVGASSDGTARVWNATSPYRRWSSPPIDDRCGVVLSLEPDRRFIASSCRDHGTRVWDTARDRLLAQLPSVTPVEGDFTSAFPAVSAAGDRAAIARGNAVEIYELPGGHLLRTIAQAAAVNAVAFAPAGHDLVSGSIDGSLLVTRDEREPIALPASPAGIDTAAILADGRVLAAAGKRLRVYDPDRGAVLADLAMPARAGSLRGSPDGKTAVTVSLYTTDAATSPALWDLQQNRAIGQLEGHRGRVFSARFVARGEILTTGFDGTVRRWDGATGQLRESYLGNTGYLADATLSPDGAMVVAGGGDGVLRFWDASSARPLWKLQAHKSSLIAVHFEGNDIVTRGLFWDVSRWTLPKPEKVVDPLPATQTLATGRPGS